MKGTPHLLAAGKPAARGNLFEAQRSILEKTAGGINACFLDELGRCHPQLFQKHAREIARAHACARGQGLHREILVEVLQHPIGQVAKHAASRCLCSEMAAELRLPSRALEKNHQAACHGEGQGMTKILLDQGQGQIDACGYTSRGVDLTVAHEDGIGFHGNARIAGEQRHHRPVRCRPASIQQSGLSQEESATAYRGQAPHASSPSPQPVEKGRVARSLMHLAAGHDQRVDPGSRREVGVLRQDREPRAGGDWASMVCQDPNVVGRRRRGMRLRPAPVGHCKNFQRPGQVERLDAVVDDERDRARAACGHAGILGWSSRVLNDKQQAISAIRVRGFERMGAVRDLRGCT